MNLTDYEMMLRELTALDRDFIIVEKNRLTFRSIMYTQKNELDVNTFEIRDKKLNLKTVEKRKMNYAENTTAPLHFETEQEFEDFDYNHFTPEVQFSFIKTEVK